MTNDLVTVRPYAASDEPAVIVLWRECLGYAGGHRDPAASLRRKLAFQPELFYVAVDGDALAGTILGGYDGHRGWIYSLAVAPSLRRRGIATQLVRHLEARLAELDCPKVNLQINRQNAEVVAFYESLGYHVEERISMGRVL